MMVCAHHPYAFVLSKSSLTTSDVTVSWIQEEYNSTEGSTFLACVQHLETTETNFTISITLPNSEGMDNVGAIIIIPLLSHNTDLMLIPLILTFPPGVGLSSQCTEVTISSTDGLEDQETYSLTLESPDPAQIVIGSPGITYIHIENTDGNSY